MPDKILVVDDEKEITNLIEVHLKNETTQFLNFTQERRHLNL